VIDLDFILSRIEDSIGPLAEDIAQKLKKNIVDIFKKEASLEIKEAYMDVYDELMHLAESRTGPSI